MCIGHGRLQHHVEKNVILHNIYDIKSHFRQASYKLRGETNCGGLVARRIMDLEAFWFDSCPWQFADSALILGICLSSSFHSQPTLRFPPYACVTENHFLTVYDYSC